MPHFLEGSAKSATAATALSMGTVVKLTAYNTVAAAAAATDNILGYVMEDAAAGRAVSVKLLNGSGTAPAVAGGTITIGSYVTSNGTGQVIAATQAAAAAQPTTRVIGLAVEAGVAGQVIEVEPLNFIF